MSEEKTQEELRKEMYEKLSQVNQPQHLTEVAMPGVIRPVNSEEIDPEQ